VIYASANSGDAGVDNLMAGVELGGTKCICTLASGPNAIIEQQTISTTTPDETLPAILEVLTRWYGSNGFAALGIASFGPLDLNPTSPRYGRILATTKVGWLDTDVLGTLSAPFAVPVGFDTDVNGAALAEGRWGSARDLDDFAYVTVGTGIGVGLIVHGKPTRGIGHSELGHVRVPRAPGDTLKSVCGFHADCVEGVASGTAVKARLGSRSIESITPADPLWDPVVDALAALCHTLVCATGPHRIALGGGVISRQPYLIERIDRALVASLGGYINLPNDDSYVIAPELGDLAGPLGTIALAAAAL
jgi:fructokinase